MSFRDSRHRAHGGVVSNGNIAVYIFLLLFTVWVAFQIWSRYGGGAPPAGLDPMVMAALGVAVAGKSVERGAQDKALADDVQKLKEVAEAHHPDAADVLEEKPKKRAPRKKAVVDDEA